MKYLDIKNKLAPLKIFTSQDIYLVDPQFRQPTLSDWVKNGRVILLRQNHYCFPDYQPNDTQLYFVANKLYQPSYISLELALNHYGVIPEAVQLITSLSTRKTQFFQTPLGNYSYQSISEKLFWGYQVINTGEQKSEIAYLEKAVLDYLYLHSEIDSPEAFSGSRWNKSLLLEQLDMNRLGSYQKIFNNLALNQRVDQLHRYLES